MYLYTEELENEVFYIRGRHVVNIIMKIWEANLRYAQSTFRETSCMHMYGEKSFKVISDMYCPKTLDHNILQSLAKYMDGCDSMNHHILMLCNSIKTINC